MPSLCIPLGGKISRTLHKEVEHAANVLLLRPYKIKADETYMQRLGHPMQQGYEIFCHQAVYQAYAGFPKLEGGKDFCSAPP